MAESPSSIALHVEFDDQLMQRYAARGAGIPCVVYWTFDGVAYPRENWEDFGPGIVASWLSRLASLGAGSSQETLIFMEGPYAITICRDAPTYDTWLRGKRGALKLDPGQLFESVLNAAHRIAVQLRRLGIGKEELSALDEGCRRLNLLRDGSRSDG